MIHSDFQPLTVDLGERSYQVHFYEKLTIELGQEIQKLCKGVVVVVSNAAIWLLHGDALADVFAKVGLDFELHLIGDGERYKSLETASQAYDFLIEKRVDRRATIVAFGGGVVGDLAGFVAATYMRGIDFIQIPTTVVSMVDSSVGGKTGVDHPRGKNMVGCFHQPRLVAVCLEFLQTLDEHNMHGGFAEVIKYGVIRDAEFFAYLEKNLSRALALDTEALMHCVRRSCAIKAEVVIADEREGGLRGILNYGHTFGHAMESLGEYELRQVHGQAVGAGMVCAGDLSVAGGYLKKAVADRIEALISACGLPTRIFPGIKPEAMWERMHADKKAEGGKLRFVVAEDIGRVRIEGGFPEDLVMEIVRARASS